MQRLPTINYMNFPFTIGQNGAVTCKREKHIKDQIEQVLFTSPKERVFQPEFGAGVRQLVFEPNQATLWEVIEKRLTASLIDALLGEVDPQTLEVNVSGEETRLIINVSYVLAAIDKTEEHQFEIDETME